MDWVGGGLHECWALQLVTIKGYKHCLYLNEIKYIVINKLLLSYEYVREKNLSRVEKSSQRTVICC